MNNKKLMRVIALLAFFVTACARGSAKQPLFVNGKMGWILGNCLAIKNASLKVPQSLTIIRLADGAVVDGAIVGKAMSSEQCPALMQDRAKVNKHNGYHFYSVKADKNIGMAVGILGEVNAGGLKVSSCTASEGVRFVVSNKHKTVWSGYYYLGYDVKPTCH